LSFALAISIIVTTLVYHVFASIGEDATLYALLGKNLAQHGAFEIFGKPNLYFSPVLPFSIAVLFKLFGNLELSAHLAVIVFGLAAVPLMYVLGRQIADRRVAVSAAVLLALNGGWLWTYTTAVTPQIIAGFLSIILVILMIRASRFPSKKLMAAIGVVNGLAYLNRPEYFFIIIPVLLYLAVAIYGISPKKMWQSLLLTCIGFAIIAGPYLIFLHGHLGRWTISDRISAISETTSGVSYESVGTGIGNQLTTDIIDGSQSSQTEGLLSSIWHHKSANIKKFLKGLRDSERNGVRMLGFLGVGLAAFGLREFLLKRRFYELAAIAVALLPIPIIAFAQGGTAEYLIQFTCWLLLLVAIGFWSLFEDFPPNWWRIVIFSCLSLLTVAYLFFPIIQAYLFLPRDIYAREYKTMGLWLNTHIPDIADQTILARTEEFSLYAGSKWEITPNVPTFQRLYEIMKANGVHYLLADDRSKLARPQFAVLLDGNDRHPPLVFVHRETYGNNSIVLYRLDY
jgi:hypothetical protein